MADDRSQTTDLMAEIRWLSNGGLGIGPRKLRFLLGRVDALHAALAHGSEDHRAWLKKAIEDHFTGRPVEAPRG